MAIVDIAIPCYRYGHFLETCVRSILSQSMSDVRILIIDDASPDGSGDVARAIAATDPRVDVSVHPTNRGHIATFNEGIDWAESPYFICISADDYLAPGALERAVGVMEANPNVVLTYGAAPTAFAGQPDPVLDDTPGGAPQWTVRSGRELVEQHCKAIRNLVPTPTAIVRTATQKAIGGYRPTLPHTSDMEMWLRFGAHGDVAETKRNQAVYRVHGANMSADYYKAVLIDYTQRAAVFDTFFAADGQLLEGADDLQRLARRRLAAAAFWTGVAQWCRGNRRIGRDVFRFGLELEPSMRFAPPLGQLMRLERIDLRLKSIMADLLASGGRSPVRTQH